MQRLRRRSSPLLERASVRHAGATSDDHTDARSALGVARTIATPAAGGITPARLSGATCPAQHPVEVEGGADQREVREGLREVPQRLPARAGLLGVEAQVVGIT